MNVIKFHSRMKLKKGEENIDIVDRLTQVGSKPLRKRLCTYIGYAYFIAQTVINPSTVPDDPAADLT